MMNRKMKQLALAVGVALGSAGLLPSAQAVYVSPDNLGQALIFPYYTVRAGWNTLIGVTNTTDLVVAVKVRFREAYNSRDVLDFNVILSPYDLWNATVYDDGSGRPVLGINPDENTCTVGLNSKAEAFPGPYSYVNSTITGVDARDGGPTTVERMRSGYVEMIMMGAAPPNSPLGSLAVHGDDESDPPADCTRLSKIFRATADSGYATPAAALAAINADFNRYPANALSGMFSLVNGAKGFNAMGRATHLANFRTPDAPAGTRNTLHRGPNGITFENSWHEPSLNAANTQGTYIIPPQTLFAGNASGAAAVTSALQAAAVSNEWSRNPTGQIPGGTSFITSSDWVITLPTKNFYVDTATHEYAGRVPASVYGGRANLPTGAPAPFAQNFANGASCDRAELLVYNREEDPVDVEIPSPGPGFQLCREVNVLTFNEGELLGNLGDDAVQIYYPATFLYGWMRVSFNAALPAVGFSIQSRDDDGGLLTEAALYNHSIVRPAAPPTGGQ